MCLKADRSPEYVHHFGSDLGTLGTLGTRRSRGRNGAREVEAGLAQVLEDGLGIVLAGDFVHESNVLGAIVRNRILAAMSVI